MKRIDALRHTSLGKGKSDGFLITRDPNLFYFTGVHGTACMLVTKDDAVTYVYGTNYENAKADSRDSKVELVERNENLMEKLASQAKACKIQNLAVDAINACSYEDLKKRFGKTAKLTFQVDKVWALRKIKDNRELHLMRKAAELTSIGMKVAYETVRPGVKETDVAGEIEYAMRKKGSWGTGFESSVASGVRSAYPHGGCTEKKIQKGDLVVIDIGANYQDYLSDMTRTIVAGKPSQKQKKLFEIVKEANERAFNKIKPEAKAQTVDLAARKVITEAGCGKCFPHGLGHGIGLEVHEPPALGAPSKDMLAKGNVVTDEPGIYLIGFGGVRVEDSVLVCEGKAERLTIGPYSLEADK